MVEARAFWLVAPGRDEIRPVTVPEPGRAAGERRQTLAGWLTTTTVIAHVLPGTAR